MDDELVPKIAWAAFNSSNSFSTLHLISATFEDFYLILSFKKFPYNMKFFSADGFRSMVLTLISLSCLNSSIPSILLFELWLMQDLLSLWLNAIICFVRFSYDYKLSDELWCWCCECWELMLSLCSWSYFFYFYMKY